MTDWRNMEGHKGKKNKKKQTASLSEPIDLEAGEYNSEPLASDVAKPFTNAADAPVSPPALTVATDQAASETTDITVPNSSKGDFVTGDFTPMASKKFPKPTNAPVPPLPKLKPKTTGTKTMKGTVHDDVVASNSADVVVPDSFRAETVKNRTKEETSKDTVDVTKVPVSDVPKTKTASKKAMKKTTQIDSPAPKTKNSDAPESSEPDAAKGDEKEKLRMNPLVSMWSFAPDPPKKGIAREETTAKAGHWDVTTASADLLEPHMSKAKQNVQPETIATRDSSMSKNHTFDVDGQSITSTPSEAVSSRGLPPLPPFNHRAFSRINNVPNPIVNDHGPMLKVQTDKGTFTNIHQLVLCQSSKYFLNMCDPAYLQKRGDPNKLTWSAKSSFKGVTSTYVHWLYNSNLPTATIDVSDKTKVGAVLLHLAEQYILGNKILDMPYQNAIMDYFITIHVRTRKLSFRSVIDVVYKGTDEGSPMRQLFADMHAFVVVDDVGKLEMMDHMPKAFVKDVLESVLMLRPNEVGEWWWYLEKTGKMYHK